MGQVDLFMLDSTVTAVIACNDDMAMGTIEALRMIDAADQSSNRMRQ